jgi:hypothetical protein
MEPNVKRPKKKVKKAAAEGQQAAPAAKKFSCIIIHRGGMKKIVLIMSRRSLQDPLPQIWIIQPRKMIPRPTEMGRKTKYRTVMIFPLIPRRLQTG